MYSVYMHISPSHKKYIGITKNAPSWRWRNGSAYSTNTAFSRAIKKYGWGAFQHGIIAQGLTKEEAESMEVALISFHRTREPKYGYNISIGGHIAYPNPSEEFKEKLRIANTGANNHKSIRIRCIETGREYESVNLAAKALGLKKENILRVLSGRNKKTGGYSFEAVEEKDRKEKIKTLTREQVAEKQRRKVAVYSGDGEFLEVCPSRSEAAKKYGTTTMRVSGCIHGHRASANGYIFKEASDKPPIKISARPLLLGDKNPAARAIDCYTADGVFIKHYNYATLAKEELGIDLSSIIKVCKGKKKQYGKYVFKYSNNHNAHPAGWVKID